MPGAPERDEVQAEGERLAGFLGDGVPGSLDVRAAG